MEQVRDIDRGWDRIKRDLALMKGAAVKIGVQQDEPARADGTSMVVVAAANEFGTENGRIPERSFLRSTADANRGSYLREMAVLLRSVIAGRGTVHRALSVIGQRVQSDVQVKIRDISTPPNAPSTVERKGSSNPLIDTGALRQSIRYEVEGAGR